MRIRAYQIKDVHVPLDAWIVEDTSTMGRMVKRMFEKGHLAARQYAMESVAEVIEFDPSAGADEVIRQVYAMERRGERAVKVLIGPREFRATLNACSPLDYPFRCEAVFDGQHRILGLPATIVPHMEGVLVLSEEMMRI